ncbi:MAG TPA: hypothetical protein VFO60_09295, partial [Candidatus Dormibacteraeota bacterium]|nr:hypothetical protein [Candidatus Dormibacteraeota bacterium]
GATKTQTGLVAATPAHAPPEVLRGEDPSVRGDVYSLASTLWALLAGVPAFLRPDETTIFALLRRVEEDPVPDLRPRGVPDPICRVLERAMSKDPMMRPATANEFGAELLAARDQARAWPAGPGQAGGTLEVAAPPRHPTAPIGPPPGQGSPMGGAPVPPGPGAPPPPQPPPGGVPPGVGTAWPAAAAGPPRRMGLTQPQQVAVVLSVLAAAAVLAVVLVAVVGRSSGSGGTGQGSGSHSASGSDSASTDTTDTGGSGGAGVDSCLVGSWTATGVSGEVSAAGFTLHLSGGDGEKLVVNDDGTYTDDYSSAKPIQGDAGSGVTFTITNSGRATGHLTVAHDGSIAATIDDPNALTQTISAAGVSGEQTHPSEAVSGSYTCANGGFRLVAPDGTTTTYTPG